MTPGFVELNASDAASLSVTDGDGVEVGEGLATLAVKINDSMAAGCVGYSAGLAGTENLAALEWVSLRRAASWQRPPELIGSDRNTGPGVAHV